MTSTPDASIHSGSPEASLPFSSPSRAWPASKSKTCWSLMVRSCFMIQSSWVPSVSPRLTRKGLAASVGRGVLSARAVTAGREDRSRHAVERDLLHHGAALERRARHAVDQRRLLVLAERHGAGL